MGNYLTVIGASAAFGIVAMAWRYLSPAFGKGTKPTTFGAVVFVVVFIIANIIYFSRGKKSAYRYRDEEKRNKRYKNFVRLV